MLLKFLVYLSFACISVLIAIGLFYPERAYYYNAYSLGYDDYFIIKSYVPLPMDTVVHMVHDNHALVTEEITGFQAKILSPYIK